MSPTADPTKNPIPIVRPSTYGCLCGQPIALLFHFYGEAGVARVFGFALPLDADPRREHPDR